MITVTPQAAAQIAKSAQQSGAGGACLRLAARLDAKGVIEYGMGFDDKAEGDTQFESAGEGGGSCHVVVGVGLNVGMPGDAVAAIDQPWCDLAGLLGERAPSRNRLATQLVDRLLPLLAHYPSRGLAPYLPTWQKLDALLGREVRLQLGDRVVTGQHRGVDRDGALLLEHDGALQRYHGGEVTLRGVA